MNMEHESAPFRAGACLPCNPHSETSGRNSAPLDLAAARGQIQRLSIWDRLLVLAADREPESLCYRGVVVGKDIDRDFHAGMQSVMSQLHLEVFQEWLALPVEHQVDQILAALAVANTSELMALTEVYEVATRPTFLPPGALPHEAKLYLNNLDMSIGLILNRIIRAFVEGTSQSLSSGPVSSH